MDTSSSTSNSIEKKQLAAAVHKAGDSVRKNNESLTKFVSEIIIVLQNEFRKEKTALGIKKVGSKAKHTDISDSDIDLMFLFERQDTLPAEENASELFNRIRKVVKEKCKAQRKLIPSRFPTINGNRDSCIEVLFDSKQSFDVGPKFKLNNPPSVYSFKNKSYKGRKPSTRCHPFVKFDDEIDTFPFPRYCRFVKKVNTEAKCNVPSTEIEKELRKYNSDQDEVQIETSDVLWNLHTKFTENKATGKGKGSERMSCLKNSVKKYYELPFFATEASTSTG